MKDIIERQFGWLLAAAFVLGLFVPGLEKIPSVTLIFILAFVIFLSSFKMSLADLSDIATSRLVLFYILRFLLLPVLFLVVGKMGYPDEALGLFLLSLMPAGVSSPAFAGLLKGNVALALVLVVLSTLLAPLVVPMWFLLFTSSTIALDTTALFVTLSLSVFVPMLVHLPFRRNPKFVGLVRHYGSAVSISCIAGTITLVVSKRREAFLAFGSEMWIALGFSFFAYGLFYLLGHAIPKSPRRDDVSFAICSGANNVALGISLAFLYFPPKVSIFMVLCEIPWTLLILPYRRWVK